MVQVGDGFSHGKHDLVRVQFSREKGCKKLPRAAWHGTGSEKFRAAVVVVLDELIHAQTDVSERAPVGW
jgi:hypothetical protein